MQSHLVYKFIAIIIIRYFYPCFSQFLIGENSFIIAVDLVDKNVIEILVEDNIVATFYESADKGILVNDNLIKHFSQYIDFKVFVT